MPSNKCTLLIDADMTLYKAAGATELAADWGDDLWVMSSNLNEAKDLVRNTLKDHMDRFDTDRIVPVLSDPAGGNFRFGVDPSYKSNRKGTRKPLIYPQLRDWLIEEYQAVFRPNLEGDDLLGLYATNPKTLNPVIISDDKDMLTIPGILYRLDVLITVDKAQAYLYWLTQALTGDATDGYKGCPGIGPVGAKKILGTTPTFGKVVKAYEGKGLSYDDALANARMARILHHGDWDAVTQTVNLWTPTEEDMRTDDDLPTTVAVAHDNTSK